MGATPVLDEEEVAAGFQHAAYLLKSASIVWNRAGRPVVTTLLSSAVEQNHCRRALFNAAFFADRRSLQHG
jgi:hypothetical protein